MYNIEVKKAYQKWWIVIYRIKQIKAISGNLLLMHSVFFILNFCFCESINKYQLTHCVTFCMLVWQAQWYNNFNITMGGWGAPSNKEPLKTETNRCGQHSDIQTYPPEYGNFVTSLYIPSFSWVVACVEHFCSDLTKPCWINLKLSWWLI